MAKNVARPSVTLTSPVDNATLALPVTDGTKFRQYQIIGVDLELMQVCSTAALSITTCGRGLGGTTAAAHSTGAVIGFPFADIQVNQLAAEIKAIEGAIINGPLLVGTTTSSGTAKLQVAGNLSLSATSPMITLTTDGSYTWGIKNATTTGDLQVVKGAIRYIQVGYSNGAVALNPSSGNTLIGTSTDNGTDKLQVNGTVSATTFKGALQGNADTVTNGVVTGGSYSDPAWLTISKAKVGLGSVENTALSTWAGTTNITTIGALGAYVKAPKQINFSMYDPSTALAAATIAGIWRAEYGGATVATVNCASDTNDAVIQIKKNSSTNMLSANLTCSGWGSTSSFAAATLALGDDIGLQIVSGTAKRINVSIKYTQQ